MKPCIKMKRRSLPTHLCMCIGMLCALVVLPSNAVAANKVKPNIVLLLADDLGWTGAECYGGKFYDTPHIDIPTLAKETPSE